MTEISDFQLGDTLKGKRIVVAMSGGVDSSVVAALAAQTGAETIGITLQLYDHGEAVGRAGSCCAGRDIRDARAVCDRLGIAHYVYDHESSFRKTVIDGFADEYLAGRTPIPCVRCNMGPKFTDLFGLARDLGADCLATGHYVRRVEGLKGAELHRAIDPARDQSYFLFATTQHQLDYLRFPLGGLPKAKVRQLAADETRRAAEVSTQIDCPLLNLWLGQDGYDYPLQADFARQRNWMVEGIRAVATEFTNLRFALEYKPKEPRNRSFHARAADTLLMVQEIGLANVGVCVDVMVMVGVNVGVTVGVSVVVMVDVCVNVSVIVDVGVSVTVIVFVGV